MGAAYQFKPHEYPVLPGSPYNPDHPRARMVAYGAIGLLAATTGGLGNALVTANLAYFQGSLNLSADEAAWIPAAYATTYICANLVLVKFRQQFGLLLFIRLVLVGYVLSAVLHLFVHGFWSAILVRAVSGIVAGGLTALGILAWMQALPPPVRILGIIIGVGIPQLATPFARMIAPSLLLWGDWRMSYLFELGLALLTLAAVLVLPLPPSRRTKVFEPIDFLTIALVFPGVGLLCSVIALGRTDWWFSTPWLGWALIGAIVLIGAGLMIEKSRKNPLLMTDFLGQRAILRIVAVAFLIRLVTAEQTYGAVSFLAALGYGTEQIQPLFTIVTLASVAGLAAAVLSFKPQSPARPLQAACLIIAIASFMDSRSTSLSGPHNFYLTQAMLGFAQLLFIGSAMVIGLTRALLVGPQNFISWVVIFLASQNLGGLAGSALFGTLQTVREKFHSSQLIEHIQLSSPEVVSRLAGTAQQIGGVVTDPSLRSAEAGALLSQQATREANVLAFNDVFLAFAVLAFLLFLWGVAIELKLRRQGEVSPIVRFGQQVAQQMAAAEKQAQTK